MVIIPPFSLQSLLPATNKINSLPISAAHFISFHSSKYFPMQFSRFLLISSFAFLISLHFANSEHHGHQGHGHGHGHHGGGHGHSPSPEHRIQREHSQHHAGGGGPPSHHFQGHPQSGGSCGCSASNARHPFIAPQNGIPIFLFPDHAQKAVDVILGAEGAFYWDNDELAHRVFDLLAHKFPQKWFLVGVGNSPGAGLGFRLLKGQRDDLLQGVVKVSPGHGPFAFFDRRQFPRENETQLWYFVRAVEPTEAEEGAEGSSQHKREKVAKKMAECVRRETKSCVPASLASTCSLDFLALIDQNTHPAIYASEALSANQMQLKVLQTITQCTVDNEGTRFYAVMAKGPTNEDGESGEGEE